jgi:hypothetical protein
VDASAAKMPAVVAANGVLLSRTAIAQLVAALDTLAELARVREQRLPEDLRRLRFDLANFGTRVGTRVDASELAESTLDARPWEETGLIDVSTAAKRLEIKEDSVRDLCRRGRLTAMRNQGRWLILASSVDSYIAARKTVS